MRIATNKLQDLIAFYYTELEGMYERDEITAMIHLAVEHFLGYSQAELISRSGNNLNQSALIKLYDCCKDLKRNIPLQYILNEAWFYDLKFKVNPSVLIPRPETEELVHLVLNENKFPFSMLDIGTGSGCIPIAVKKNSELSQVAACDISVDALNVANENARILDADITFFEADVLQTNSFHEKISDRFQVVISNPPYIKSSEKMLMEKHVLDQEPHLALFVEGEDPVVFYKKIIDLCDEVLEKQGCLYFELNPLTAADVDGYAKRSGLFEETKLIKDMSGKLRFFKGQKF